MTDLAIHARGLYKSFGETKALAGVDLHVPRGTVCGLLGPNGAGKTTAVRILTTLQRPDGGSAEVLGLDVVRDAEALRYRIGLAGQAATVDGLLTGRENLELVGRLYRLPRAYARERAEELLASFQLSEAADRVTKGYSGGMRRRLDLACALVAAPELLVLDEPTTGLDPRSRTELWDVLDDLVRGGTTLLLTTQYLDEADRLADRITVVDHGRVIAEGTPADLKSQVGGERVDVVVQDPSRLDDLSRAIGRATGQTPVIDREERRITVAAERGPESLSEVVRELDATGIAVEDVGLRRPSLDDVFLRLTGHAAEEHDPAGPEDTGPEPGNGSGPAPAEEPATPSEVA